VVPVGSDAGAIRHDDIVYETLEPLTIHSDLNQIRVYDWGQPGYTLPVGSTSAVLCCSKDTAKNLRRWPGRVLIFETRPEDGAVGRGNSTFRHAVRINGVENMDSVVHPNLVTVFWNAEDALPKALPITVEDGLTGDRAVLVAQGNCVAADLGHSIKVTINPPSLQPWYAPQLRLKSGLVHCCPRPPQADASATATMTVAPADTVPAIRLRQAIAVGPVHSREGTQTIDWTVRRDLLASGPLDRHFVVETGEAPGELTLRFGNGVMGARPPEFARFHAWVREAYPPWVNVGADTLNLLVVEPKAAPELMEAVVSVRNPLPAQGGYIPDTIEAIRQAAPLAYLDAGTCITAEDFRAALTSDPAVSEVLVREAWSGTIPVVTLYVRRNDGEPVDRACRDRLLALLEPRRVAGRIIAIEGPSCVPIKMALNVRAVPGVPTDAVHRRLLAAFSAEGGFFAPSHWRFGQPLFASTVLEHARSVPGVADVAVTELRRLDWPPESDLGANTIPGRAAIAVAAHEVIEADLATPGRSRPVGGQVEINVYPATEPRR
jgi:hypothetical protein